MSVSFRDHAKSWGSVTNFARGRDARQQASRAGSVANFKPAFLKVGEELGGDGSAHEYSCLLDCERRVVGLNAPPFAVQAANDICEVLREAIPRKSVYRDETSRIDDLRQAPEVGDRGVSRRVDDLQRNGTRR